MRAGKEGLVIPINIKQDILPEPELDLAGPAKNPILPAPEVLPQRKVVLEEDQEKKIREVEDTLKAVWKIPVEVNRDMLPGFPPEELQASNAPPGWEEQWQKGEISADVAAGSDVDSVQWAVISEGSGYIVCDEVVSLPSPQVPVPVLDQQATLVNLVCKIFRVPVDSISEIKITEGDKT